MMLRSAGDGICSTSQRNEALSSGRDDSFSLTMKDVARVVSDLLILLLI